MPIVSGASCVGGQSARGQTSCCGGKEGSSRDHYGVGKAGVCECSFGFRHRQQLFRRRIRRKGHVEKADHHLIEALLAPGYRLGGIGVVRVLCRVVVVRGALDPRARRQHNRFGQVVPKLPAPVIVGHVQDGACLSVGKYQPVRHVFAAHMHMGMQAQEGHFAAQGEGGIHAVIRIAGRNLEVFIARLQRHDAILGRLFCQHQAHVRLVRSGFSFRHVMHFEHDI